MKGEQTVYNEQGFKAASYDMVKRSQRFVLGESELIGVNAAKISFMDMEGIEQAISILQILAQIRSTINESAYMKGEDKWHTRLLLNDMK